MPPYIKHLTENNYHPLCLDQLLQHLPSNIAPHIFLLITYILPLVGKKNLNCSLPGNLAVNTRTNMHIHVHLHVCTCTSTHAHMKRGRSLQGLTERNHIMTFLPYSRAPCLLPFPKDPLLQPGGLRQESTHHVPDCIWQALKRGVRSQFPSAVCHRQGLREGAGTWRA